MIVNLTDLQAVLFERLFTFTKHEDLKMCFFHKWGKWESYETTIATGFFNIPCKSTNVRQKRVCSKCGYTQDEHVVNKQFVSLHKHNLPTE